MNQGIYLHNFINLILEMKALCQKVFKTVALKSEIISFCYIVS